MNLYKINQIDTYMMIEDIMKIFYMKILYLE